MPVSRPRPREAREGRSFAQTSGAPPPGIRRAPYEPPIRGINEGQLFSSLLGSTVWGTAKILGSLPFLSTARIAPTCHPVAAHYQHKHSSSSCCYCRRRIPFHPPGLGRSSLSSRSTAGGDGWGPSKLPVSQVSTPQLAPRPFLHLLICHCFPPNKVQTVGAVFREPPRIPRNTKPSSNFLTCCHGGAQRLLLSRGWRVLRIFQWVPHRDRILEMPACQPIWLGAWAI